MNGKGFETPENFRKYLLQVNIRSEVNSLIKSLNYSDLIQRSADDFSEDYKIGERIEAILKPIIICFVLHVRNIRSPLLLQFLRDEPNQFKGTFKEVVFRELLDRLSESKIRPGVVPSFEQLHLFIRIEGFGFQEELAFDPSKYLIRTGLSILHCLLGGFVVHEKCILQTTWTCSKQCIGNVITGEVASPLPCPTCGVIMKEYTKNRYMCDKTLLKVYPAQSLENPRVSGKIFRSITVELLYDLSDTFLDLGAEYKVVGVYDCRSQLFKAWGIEQF